MPVIHKKKNSEEKDSKDIRRTLFNSQRLQEISSFRNWYKARNTIVDIIITIDMLSINMLLCITYKFSAIKKIYIYIYRKEKNLR